MTSKRRNVDRTPFSYREFSVVDYKVSLLPGDGDYDYTRQGPSRISISEIAECL